jgi:hypothetical protein
LCVLNACCCCWSDETKWTRADVLEWMEHRSGVDELRRWLGDGKTVSDLLDCFARSRSNLPGIPFASLFTSAQTAQRLTARVEDAVAAALEACRAARSGAAAAAAVAALGMSLGTQSTPRSCTSPRTGCARARSRSTLPTTERAASSSAPCKTRWTCPWLTWAVRCGRRRLCVSVSDRRAHTHAHKSQDEYEDLRETMACQCTVDVVVGALCLHPQMAGTSLAPGEFPANDRLVEQLLHWLGQLAAVKDRTAERGNVLVVLTYADKFALTSAGAKSSAGANAKAQLLEEKCRAVQAALRAQFPAWIPEWGAGQRRVVFAVSPTDDALISPLVEQVRLLTAALVVDTPVPASYNRAVKLLRALGTGCRLPLFAEEVVATQLPESSAQDRAKALEHCVRVGEAVRVARAGADRPATRCLLLTPAAFLSRVLRCFISHRDDRGVPLGAKALLDKHKAAPGVYTLSAIAQHVHSSVLLGETAAAAQAEQLSMLGAASDAERSAQLLSDTLCALGFCRLVSLNQPATLASDRLLVVFPASTLPLPPADVGARWHHELTALQQVAARPQSPQPWLGCAGLRWQSGNAARRARMTSSVITRVLDAIRLEARLEPSDIGGEFLLFRAEAGTVAILLTSGRSAADLEGDWCDAYVCALGEVQDAAVANLRMALDAVSSVLLVRLGEGAQRSELCPACLFHAGVGARSNAAAPLAARLPQPPAAAAAAAAQQLLQCARCRDRSAGPIFLVEHRVRMRAGGVCLVPPSKCGSRSQGGVTDHHSNAQRVLLDGAARG